MNRKNRLYGFSHVKICAKDMCVKVVKREVKKTNKREKCLCGNGLKSFLETLFLSSQIYTRSSSIHFLPIQLLREAITY